MRKHLFLLLLALLLIFSSLTCIAKAQQSSASAAISDAQKQLVNCYNAAKAAEAAGANITKLTNTLNNAGILLSKAEQAYSIGDDSTAQSLAVESQNTLNGFVHEANSLQTSAQQASTVNSIVFASSIVGTIAVIIGSISIWILLNRKYKKNGAKTD